MPTRSWNNVVAESSQALGLELEPTILSSSIPNESSSPSPLSDSISSLFPTPVPLNANQFDHFMVERALGRGGMGVVYLARDISLDRPVAIKVLPDELASRKDLQERFVREARAQARLSSPHVVQIYYIGHVPNRDTLYFAMEYVEGQALDAILDEKKTLGSEEARRLMVQVAIGLRDAHRAGIIHRDIKPSNLLRDLHGTIKIADFGLAKPLAGNSKITQEGAILGSPLYMSPEQARGDDVAMQADMYSLGCTFYHLLCGSPPFDAATALGVITKHLTSQLPPLRQKSPSVAPRIAAIIERLMQKEPSKRYATYDDLIAQLEAAAPGLIESGGFWTRSAAILVDAIPAIVLTALLGLPGMLLHLTYVTIAHARYGCTLGKYLFRIQVRRLDGARLSFARSAARTLASLWLPVVYTIFGLARKWIPHFDRLSAHAERSHPDVFMLLVVLAVVIQLILFLLYAAGLIMAAFERNKRALHDFVVGSRVTYRLANNKQGSLPEDQRTFCATNT